MASIHAYVVDCLKRIPPAQLILVERATGIPVSTLAKIRGRWIENPGVKGIEALARHFKRQEATKLRRRKAA